MKGDISYQLLRECVRAFVRACALNPSNLTREQHAAFLRGGELLRELERKEQSTKGVTQ